MINDEAVEKNYCSLAPLKFPVYSTELVAVIFGSKVLC